MFPWSLEGEGGQHPGPGGGEREGGEERGGPYWLWCEAIYKVGTGLRGRSKCLVISFLDFGWVFFFFTFLFSAFWKRKWSPNNCIRRVTVQSENFATLLWYGRQRICYRVSCVSWKIWDGTEHTCHQFLFRSVQRLRFDLKPPISEFWHGNKIYIITPRTYG